MTDASTSSSTIADLLPTLQTHWGFPCLKAEQETAVQATLDRRDSLVVLSTGFGKSICFQLPAAAGVGEWSLPTRVTHCNPTSTAEPPARAPPAQA